MEKADVIILGGGLVGLTVAIALDRHGLSSIVVDPAEPEKVAAPRYDCRATAVASASWRCWRRSASPSGWKGRAARSDRSGSATGWSRAASSSMPDPATPAVVDPLGIMFENRLLRRALRETAEAAEHGTLAAAGARGRGGSRRERRPHRARGQSAS
jgi:2-octaprenyl-6-methoxyphenol hydroxylase